MANSPEDDYPIEIHPIYWCWCWLNGLSRDGYPVHEGRPCGHRYVYEKEVGPIPEGMVLEHRCRNRACVSPSHLEPVTQSVNERRKSRRVLVKMDACAKGHDRYLHGRRTPWGGIVCRICE